MRRLAASLPLGFLPLALGCPGGTTVEASGTDGVDSISAGTGGATSSADASSSSSAVTSGGDASGTTATTSTDTTGASTTGTSSGEDSDGSSSGGDAVCETVLCGDADVCCDAAQECVLGACLEACDSGVRCGEAQDICCGDGQVCLGDTCADPTGDCVDSFDCDEGEFCEPTLDQCLPQFDPVDCELVPEFEDVSVTLEWSYEDDEVISIPVIADVDGDGAPEVVVNITQQEGLSWPGGNVVILDGQTGAVELEIPHDPANGMYGAHGRSTIGLTDVSGDGLPDIIYAGRPVGGVSPIHAVSFDGTLLWTSHDENDAEVRFQVENGAPSFANFDDDAEAETVFGAAMLDDDGLVVWNQGGNGAAFGTNNGYTGGISSLADLTGDGYPEVVSGAQAWSVTWTEIGGVPMVAVEQLWDAGGSDGYPAIADVDLDGTPEVVLVASGQVRVLEGDSGLAWCGVDPTEAMCNANPALRSASVSLPGGGRGGPPTVADFDGDGRPELAAAGGGSYTVYDLYREGEDVVASPGVTPSPGDIYARWSRATQDQSSNATGSSVFDFQGDGAAEVVYADECFMRVYDGASGDVLLEIESSSATIHEYPLVVDVDDDGNSEIVVVDNDSGNDCSGVPGYTERRGVFIYGDSFDQWVGTRRVWTSHAYHVTNTTSAGNAPATEDDNWTQPGLNNYRQNVQGAGVFNAPDLSVDLVAELGMCTEGALEVVATVRNAGSLGVPAGIEVSLYEGTDATGMLIGTELTPDPLLPGQQTQLSWVVPFAQGDPALDFFVAVDGADIVAGAVEECDESNNDAQSLSAECFFPG
ncbi:MAG: VCBS repeat-containing protein [Myxococcota bacterium]